MIYSCIRGHSTGLGSTKSDADQHHFCRLATWEKPVLIEDGLGPFVLLSQDDIRVVGTLGCDEAAFWVHFDIQ